MTYKSILLGASVVALAGSTAAADGRITRSSALGELKFAFDSSTLQADAPAVVGDVAAFAKAHRDAKIVLDAHTDPVGASDYNVKLAIRRAESVRAQLTAKGVSDDQIVLAVYGEDGQLRASHAEDRRVTIWSSHQPLAILIDHTFAGKGTAVTWQRPLSVAQIEGTSPVASR
jgi:outer membrane protein OmpA-like peptidoglycan-associated protein